jgi:hypothetical protein
VHKDAERLGRIPTGSGRVVDADPLPEQVLGLLEQTLRVVELPGLQDARVNVCRGAAGGTVREEIMLLVGAQHFDQAGKAVGSLSSRHADPEEHLDHVVEVALGDRAVSVVNQVQLNQLHAERHGKEVVAVVHGLSQQTVDLRQVNEVGSHKHVHDLQIVADVLATLKQTPEQTRLDSLILIVNDPVMLTLQYALKLIFCLFSEPLLRRQNKSELEK